MDEEVYIDLTRQLTNLVGTNTEEIRSVRRAFTKRLSHATSNAVMEIAGRLLEQQTFTHRFVAYELIHYHRQTAAELKEKELEALARGLDSWASVDTFASYLSGPAWRERQVRDQLIFKWAQSPDRWWRRAALVSTVPLNNKARGGSGDPDRTLAVCRLLLDDRDDMVVKAMSWALRELAKRDAPTVANFLAVNQNRLAPRVIREVNHKLSTGRKNPKLSKDRPSG